MTTRQPSLECVFIEQGNAAKGHNWARESSFLFPAQPFTCWEPLKKTSLQLISAFISSAVAWHFPRNKTLEGGWQAAALGPI